MSSLRPSRKPSSRAKQPSRGADGASVELLAESLPQPTLPSAPNEATSLLAESEIYVKAVAGAIAELAEQGFPTHFEVDDAGVHCLACRSRCNAHDVSWMAHAEVTFTPVGVADERSSFVCGLRCPICGARGTATATAEQWERRRDPRAASHTR